MNKPARKPQIINLCKFTVQIRDVNNNTVGTGFVVSESGQIVTCAHVVRDACATGEVAEGVEVDVYFSKAQNEEQKAQKARVAVCFHDYEDDVVLLQLDTPSLPDGIEVAILGTAEESAGNKFRSFGYRRLGKNQGCPAEGKIIDFAESPENSVLHGDPLMLSCQHIDSGMSGAAVLDTERDLVVGVIAQTWDSGQSEKDRDTSFAVDCKVLTFDPMRLPLAGMPITRLLATQDKMDLHTTGGQPVSEPGIVLNNAPALLPEWVGREEFLRTLNQDWVDSDCLITGLIGFGGEGKSSLTRRWLENLLQDSSLPCPQGVFWWGFDEKTSIDEFFEAALTFLVKDIDPRKLTPAEKAKFIHAMLKSGRYLFILDGLEVLQHEDGDDYGELKNADLREFLRGFATGGHQSFCLINSRVPLLDLIDFTTYTHRDVDRLSAEEGRTLLRNVGVKGSNQDLDRIVADWDGYALVLSLLGAYLVDVYNGDVKRIRDISPPTADEPRYDRVKRVLRRYDKHLTQPEKEFLTVFSAFRLGVSQSAFAQVFQGVIPGYFPPRRQTSSFVDRFIWQFQRLLNRLFPSRRRAETQLKKQLKAPLTELPGRTFDAMVRRLVNYRILRYYLEANYYAMHPLIRAHYLKQLDEDKRAQAREIHQRIADYYLRIAGPIPDHPILENLAFPIEVVHHLCCAENYDQAYDVFWERVLQSAQRVLVDQLNAWDTCLALVLEFFPNNDTSQEPQVSSLNCKAWILNEVGLCLKKLGQLSEAEQFYKRAIAIELNKENWKNAAINYQNLAGLYIELGKLTASEQAAREALTLARRAGDKSQEANSLGYQAQIAHLQGNLQLASAAFQQAEALRQEIEADTYDLYTLNGIYNADHLRRVSNLEYARRITQANLEICQRNHWLARISRCYRVFGDLDADTEQHESARENYNEALRIARGISNRDVLIEALLARGRWAARRSEVEAARSDLDEALSYALSGGYRIYEADIRVALAWAHLAEGNYSVAQVQAEKAQRMSAEMGYHWGQVDAAEVLAGLKQLSQSVLN
ncbi:trypsin-like peptidase domain-containing protein [Brasilonema bromeliae]|uniref:Serine protease n=1 Tax=Brasilonema bromeliae SPC951 TaxID=385972 RepID=A0ABX1PCD5_9CYAN|nr:trypsin-like peptidase domain-containing protein [Brasilonema bromeliae]NMG21062.1 serine protease [Brasilonema bromeliae SPC951]